MAQAHAEEHHHITPPSTFIKTFAALTILMALTIGAAFINYGTESAWVSYVANGIAMTIACIKATLVVLFFMGVKYATRLTQVFAVLGFIWVTLMAITFGDYFTRHFEPSPGWEKVPATPNTEMTEPQMVNPWEGKPQPGAAEH